MKKKMYKICYVVTIPLTIEAFFIPQLQYLAANGFNVTVVCSKDPELQGKLGESIRFYPIDIPRGISVGGSIHALRALTQFFMKEKFDLIQYSTPNAAFYSSIASKKAGCQIRNYHLMGLRYLSTSGVERIFLKTLEKIACSNSTSIECVSESNMELGIKEGLFPKEKVTVVWNGSTGGVNLSRFDFFKRKQWRMEIRKELGYSESDFVYGFVGRITKDKGIDELLSAFLGLKDNSKLLLVGNIEENNHLDDVQLKKALEHSNIKFHGFVSDIERYYAAIDVLVLPSYREGFGNVIIEAGAVGTPAIVTDIPGPRDTIVCGKTALVVPVKNPRALSKSLMQIRECDYITMGENAAQFARKKFDSEVLCRKILERKVEIYVRSNIVKSGEHCKSKDSTL